MPDPNSNDLDETKPTCIPLVFHSVASSGKSGSPYYNVYGGDSPGCYQDLGSLEVRGALTTFPNRERAFRAWRHHCILFHDHPSDFVDGTVYVKTPSDSTTTLVFPSVDMLLYSPAKLKERSPKRSPKKPVKTLPIFPSDPIPRSISPAKMVQHCRTTNVAPVLTASEPAPDAVTSAQYPRRRWAIHTPRLNAIVNAKQADRIIADAEQRDEMVALQQVYSVVDTENWLNALEYA